MSNANPPAVADSAEDLTEKSVHLASEASTWVTGNVTDILTAGGFAVAIVLVLMGLRAFGHRIVSRQTDGIDWRMVIGRVLSRTTMFFMVMCALELVAEHADTPPTLLRAINVLFVIAAAFQAAIWGRELILGLVQHKVGDDDAHSTLGSAIGIIRLLVTVALFAIALIVILDNLGVNVTGLVAGLGIGGIAIGLAAQGIFSDLFAALSILFDRPFRRGDSVQFGPISGTVENIGLKTTRVRSLTGELVVVSNAKLLEQQIHNYAVLEHRRFSLMIGLTYQTPPEVCRRVPAMLKEIVERQEHATMVRCGMVNFGASSLDFQLQFDVHTAVYDEAFQARSEICIDILDAFDKAGIDIAYPTTTNFTAAPDGSMIMPYPEVKILAEEGHGDHDWAHTGQAAPEGRK